MKHVLFFAFLCITFFVEAQIQEKNGIRLIPQPNRNEFPDAKLILDETPFFSQEYLPVGLNTFQFQVANYTLGAQTPDADAHLCANASKGQHIHFILDNAPYVASYQHEISATLSQGHHVMLAFLSRSYHESLKTRKAYVLKEFNVGKGKYIDTFNSRGPQLFFSRPKGEYIGSKETQRILLDFYLLNARLSPNGLKVRATINGTEFMLDKWQPYFIEGLPLGETKIKLELINSKGKPVRCAYNGTTRTIKLLEDGKK